MNLYDIKEGVLVKYIPKHAEGDLNHIDCELGKVKYKNSKFVFVNY